MRTELSCSPDVSLVDFLRLTYQHKFTADDGVLSLGQRSLLALTKESAGPAARVSADYPSDLRNTQQGADLLIITRREFFDSIESLKRLRQKQGLSVAVVDIEDVYDEFSFGQRTPQALKDFIGFAETG